ncbi:MAG TPA: TonB-dependent receptor [Candidatus Limnocylindria bacterium]|nr:TonB-dependent receptor [Candidatus Limnocylindria bacterium]
MNHPKRTALLHGLVVLYLHTHIVGGICGILMFGAMLSAVAAETTSPKAAPDLSELSLEALMELEVPKVYGASKFEQKTTEAPSSISLVSSDEIKKYGYRTLADVLQSLQGFHVSYDRNYAFLGTRGINLGDFNSRVLLLVNGHRVNNNITDGAFIDSAFILDVDLIDRVEVIRGPGSVLYGNNAFLGVINVVTRRGRQLHGAEVSGEYGEFDAYKGRVTYGNVFSNGVEFLLSGSLYGTDGKEKLFYKEFNTPAQNNGIARNRDDDAFGSFFGSLSYLDFTLEGAYINREKDNPTAQYFTTFNDPRLRTTDKRSYAALKYAHSFPEIVDVTAQVYYDRTEFEIGYGEKDLGEWWGAELQLNKKLWERHIVTLGAEYRDDFRQEREISGQATVRQTRQSHGVYAQGDFEIVEELHFNGGVRYDHYGDFDPSCNPRLALIYNPVPKSTFKTIYGTAFRAPNFLELADSQNSVTPMRLQPEEITSYELVYEQRITPHLRSSLSGYYNEMDDLIILESGAFANFDATTKGMEIALEGFWTNAVRGRVSYSLQKTENKTGDLELPDSPEHLIKLNLSVPLWRDKIFAGMEYQYTSARHSLHNTTVPSTVQGVDTGDFGVFNLTLFSRELIENLEFSASVYNLFDKKYSDPATRFHVQDTLEREGRTYRLKLTYRF